MLDHSLVERFFSFEVTQDSSALGFEGYCQVKGSGEDGLREVSLFGTVKDGGLDSRGVLIISETLVIQVFLISKRFNI